MTADNSMTTRTKVLIGIAIVAVIGGATAFTIFQRRDRGVPVRFDVVARRDLVETVTASGNVRAGRVIDISSDVSARVIELLVNEGDDVVEGQLLLRLDPTEFEASVARAQAQLNQSNAQVRQQEANLERVNRDYERLSDLFNRDSLLVARQLLDDAETEVVLATRQLESQEFMVDQAVASLEEANERLAKTVFRAQNSGKVTRLNVEVGETVIVGTMNNAGSLVLTISELSRVEAVLEVDETDVPYIALGDSTILELDAFPDRHFSGVVTEIGNSAIRPPASTAGSGQAAAIDFEVVITMDDPPEGIRPDLSVTADIITATRKNSLAVPIIALTVRPEEEAEEGASASAEEDPQNDGQTRGPISRPENTDVEGVFLVADGQVTFVPVEVGITGQEHFEVVSGVSEGDSIVAGPYQQIRDLADGDRVREAEDGANESSD
jgi:HlyD family secretion protein